VVTIAANYATSAFTVQLASGAQAFVGVGATRDTITDATIIAQFPSDFTANVPAAGGTITGVMAGYLAVYPRGPQVT
jgi:hypothetical protein